MKDQISVNAPISDVKANSDTDTERMPAFPLPQKMAVDYKSWRDFVQIGYWWTMARSPSDEHALFISDGPYYDYEQKVIISSKNAPISIHRLNCETLKTNEMAFIEAVRIMIVDYSYRFIVLSLRKNVEDSTEYFNDALENLIKLIKSYQPDTTLFRASVQEDEGNAKDIIEKSGSIYLNTRELTIDDRSDLISKVLTQHNNLYKNRKKNEAIRRNADSVPVSYIRNNRENVEWLYFGFNDAKKNMQKKRILLIGDSISIGYGNKVIEQLSSKYIIDYIRTSKGVNETGIYRELSYVFSQYNYDLIHMNIGLHSHGASSEEYAVGREQVFTYVDLYMPDAIKIFATTTSYNLPNSVMTQELDIVKTADIEGRNKAAEKVCKRNGYIINDLFRLDYENRLPKTDVVHFSDSGYEPLAKQVVENIEKIL